MLCLSLTLQRGPQKPALCVVWWRQHCSHYHSQNSYPTIKLYSFHLFLKETRLMRSCWVRACVCPSIYLPATFEHLAWLWSQLAEGQRPRHHQVPASRQKNRHLVWGEGDLIMGPQADKACNPHSLLDSKGSNMSHKTKRNQALPVLQLIEASQQQEPPWAVASHKAPCSPRSCSSAFWKGLKQPSVKAAASHSFRKNNYSR